MTLLNVKNLCVTIGKTPILNSVSLKLKAGEIVGLAGESGAGKSMAALAITGLLPKRAVLSGSINLDGVPLSAINETQFCQIRGRDIGIIFQEPMTALNPVMTIGDQIAETVRIHQQVSKGEARKIARQMLDRVGLPQERFALNRYPHSLSGGQCQRVAIAIAIALKPKLLIADEPTTALDVTTQAEILKLLVKLVREDNIGLILVTHDLAVIAQNADRVMVMKSGEIVDQGSIAQVYHTSTHPYTRQLLASASHAPKPHKTITKTKTKDTMPVLEVKHIVREYPGARKLLGRETPHLAVDDVSLQIFAQENVALVGESGCGKSTLLRTILGLERAQAGEVLVFGKTFPAKRAADMRDLRRCIQIVFQDPYSSFDPRWRVEQLIGENYNLFHAPPNAIEARKKVEDMLKLVGMNSTDADRFAHEFSGGQRQRIAIARALITEPAIIVLDEAVSALDVSIKAQILDLLAALTARIGVSYLFATHDLTIVRNITDRVLVMKQGRLVEQGKTEEVFANPQHPYTRALLRAVPDFGPNLEPK